MESCCIIHAGTHKTGSTAIQNSLSGLNNKTFLYAALGGEPNHSLAIFSLFAENPERHHYFLSKVNNSTASSYVKGIRRDLEKAINGSQGRNLIISGEDILFLKQVELNNLKEYLYKTFTKVVIVFYVRPPSEYISSAFQERLKHGITTFNIERQYRSYKELEKFDLIFGKENVNFWKFDPNFFPDSCVVKDFCQRLGIKLSTYNVDKINQSFSLQSVKLLFIYHKFGEKYKACDMTAPECQRLGHLLNSIGKEKFRFAYDVISPILGKNQDDIEWMENRLGLPLVEKNKEYNCSSHVRTEADLLTLDIDIVRALKDLVERNTTQLSEDISHQEVALLVHLLRLKMLEKKSFNLKNWNSEHLFQLLNRLKRFVMKIK